MKAEIRGHQMHICGLSEDKKKQTITACERRSDDGSKREVVERNPKLEPAVAPEYFLLGA